MRRINRQDLLKNHKKLIKLLLKVHSFEIKYLKIKTDVK